MTIKYKFNKSSEARDCVVESVELRIPILWDTEIKKLTREELIDYIFQEDYFKDEEEYLESKKLKEDILAKNWTLDELICQLHYKMFYDYEVEWDYFDVCKSYQSGDGGIELNNSDVTISFRVYNYSDSTEFKDVTAVFTKSTIVKEAETKQFTSSQELKNYINTIQEPIEFIAESSIDDVLMKEWIGEWIEVEKLITGTDLFGNDYGYFNDIKTGSPKLNSNWTFKIE